MPRRARSPEVVKSDVEPIVDLLVELMILVTDFLRGLLLL